MAERPNVHPDEAFQRLLLQFSVAAAQASDPDALIGQFCRETRQFFHVDGVCFWRWVSSEELVATDADGLFSDQLPGLRLKVDEAAIVCEAVRNRKTLYVSHLDPARSVLAARFHGPRSIMAAPLIVASEVVGAAAFLHASDPQFFSDDMAAKATILAGQLGSSLEAGRLSRASREEHRRTEILAEVAHTLHGAPNSSAVIDAIAERLRVLLRTRIVSVVVSEGAGFCLKAVAAESSDLAKLARGRHDRKGLQFAGELAARALAAGEPVTVAIDPSGHSQAGLAPAGTLLAAPFRTSVTEGAVLVYPRDEGAFTQEEKSLVSALTGFAAVALTNAELCASAQAQAHELHQLLDVTSDLNSIGQLDRFMHQFALRAADFLGFSQTCIGLLEDEHFHIRWKAENGQSRSMEAVLPAGAISQTLVGKHVFWSNDLSSIAGATLEGIGDLAIKQFLALPLLGADGRVLGMFAVLNQVDGRGVSPEDIRRAKALAAQAAVALEVTRDLELSEKHRQRAESLMGLALELNSLLRVQDFARSVVSRAASMMQSSFAALVVKHESPGKRRPFTGRNGLRMWSSQSCLSLRKRSVKQSRIRRRPSPASRQRNFLDRSWPQICGWMIARW
ncbi:MAG TPA: GAF domain-containing protein [Terriglobales bacterium]